MNADFLTLSTAAHQAVAATNNAPSKDVITAKDLPRKLPSRRRSTMGVSSNNNHNTLQFLEAAHRSWTFAQEDLPSVADTPVQRRKSRSHSKKFQQETGHKSWTFGEDVDTALSKRARSKMLPSRSKTHPRRASVGPGLHSSAPISEDDVTEDPAAEPDRKKGGKLARRSSLESVSSKQKNICTDKEEEAKADRNVRRDPSTCPTKRSRPKVTRRNTIHGCSEDLISPFTKPSKQSRRSIIIKTNQNAKGTVRFELDHKNRVKRHVSFIRSQKNTKTDARALWWSEEELDRIYERENDVYEKYADDPQYKKNIHQLWGNCSKAANVRLHPDAVAHVAGSASRGLEVDILETVRDRRARVLGSVLDAQETLQDFDPAVRAKVLSARYKNLCRSATRFARKMGEGDAIVAANVYSN